MVHLQISRAALILISKTVGSSTIVEEAEVLKASKASRPF